MTTTQELLHPPYDRSALRRGSWRADDLLAYLRAHRGRAVHIIDPFKVPVEEAVEKAVAVAEHGAPWLILASTDCPDFTARMATYVPAVAAAVRVPVVLHFPPSPGTGFPVVPGADGYLFPALLRSSSPYYVWQSHLESMATWGAQLPPGDWPQVVLTAAVTFGEDTRTGDLLGTVPVDPRTGVDALADDVRRLGFDLVYLYSRHGHVPASTVRALRDRLPAEHMLFVSGNVRDADRVSELLAAGADWVGFAGALESTDWRDRAASLLAPRADRPAGPVRP